MSQSKHSFTLNRREFLKGGLAALTIVTATAIAGTALTACSVTPAESSSPGDITVTSSMVANHTHNVTIPGADIENAPAEKTYTSDGATHTHTVTLKQADFQNIKNGQEVTVTSSMVGNHTHTFTVKKP